MSHQLKDMTQKEGILWVLSDASAYTCAKICEELVHHEIAKPSRYLSGSISSKLNKLVKEGILEYDKELKGPKGGYVYKLKLSTNVDSCSVS